MKSTDVMREEHGGIKLMLRITDAVLSKDQPDFDALSGIIDFYRTFADRCHHTKEEELLFPAAKGRGGVDELIEELLADHERGRSYVRKMVEALDSWRNGDPEGKSDFVRAWESYHSLLSDHIRREDEELWPELENLFSKDEHENLLEEFERVEVEKIGEGKHEEFHELMHHLRDGYLEPAKTDLSSIREFGENRFTPKTVYEGRHGKFIVAFFKEGQFIPVHTPSVDLVLFVLEGEGEVTGGSETFAVKAGDIVVVPAHVKRGVKAKTEMTVVHAVYPPPTDKDHEEVRKGFREKGL